MTYGRRYATLMIAAVGLFATLIFLVLPQAPVSARLSTSERSDLVFSEHGESTWNNGLAEASLSTSEIGEVSAYRLEGGTEGGSDVSAPMMVDKIYTVTIEAVTDSVMESAGPMTFRLSADPAPGSDLNVMISAEQPEGAAWLGPDHSEPFSVKIPAAATSRDFDVPVRNLFNAEGDGEIVVSVVEDADHYLTADPSSATVEISDDDEAITVTYVDDEDTRVSEGVGTVEVDLEIAVDTTTPPGTYEVDGEISEGFPFLIETFAGTAIPPGDYGHSFHIIRLPVGSFVKNSSGEYVASVIVAWEIEDDVLDEGEEEYFHVVTPSFGVSMFTLPSEPKRIVIEDNDAAAYTLIVDEVEIDEGESLEISALLHGDVRLANSETLTVEFSGIAEEGQDYEVDSDELTIEAGARLSTEVLTLRALEDTVAESPEEVDVKLMRAGEVVGNVASFSITDRAVSTLVSASIDGSVLTLDFNEDLDDDSTPDASAFDVEIEGVEAKVTNVSIADSTLTLGVDPAVEAGQTAMVSYTVPVSMPLQSVDAVLVAAITDFEVTNDTENRPPRILTDSSPLEFGSDLPVGSSIVTVRVVDDDVSQVLTFTLEGDEEGNFGVTTEGEWATVSVMRLIDREVTRTYDIVLRVDDGNGGTDSAEISVTLLRLGAPGEVSMMPDRPMQSLPVAANLTDDGGVSGEVDWEWGVSDTANGMFVSAQRSSSSVYVPTADDVGMYLKATAHYDDMQGTGRRAETVSSEPVGADIPDDVTTGGRITVDGGPVSGYIDPGYVTFTMNGEQECTNVRRVFDHDWWGVEVVEGRNYVIEMRGADTGDGTLLETRLWGMANTKGEDKTDEEYLDVYDAYGDIGSGSGRNSRMVFTAVETGLVYIDVSSNNAMDVDYDDCPITWWYPERQTGSYEVEVTSVTGVLPGQLGATPILVGASLTGIFDQFERRWFVVSLASGIDYEIVHERGSDVGSKLNFPVVYGIYDRDGNTVSGSSVGVHGYGDAVLNVTPEVTGDYYIQIGDGTQGSVWVDGGPAGAFHFAINEIGP